MRVHNTAVVKAGRLKFPQRESPGSTAVHENIAARIPSAPNPLPTRAQVDLWRAFLAHHRGILESSRASSCSSVRFLSMPAGVMRRARFRSCAGRLTCKVQSNGASIFRDHSCCLMDFLALLASPRCSVWKLCAVIVLFGAHLLWRRRSINTYGSAAGSLVSYLLLPSTCRPSSRSFVGRRHPRYLCGKDVRSGRAQRLQSLREVQNNRRHTSAMRRPPTYTETSEITMFFPPCFSARPHNISLSHPLHDLLLSTEAKKKNHELRLGDFA